MKRNSGVILTEWLVLSSQMGDPRALDQLLLIWYPKLTKYAGNIMQDPTGARDATQNALIVICKTIKQVKDPAAFPKWAYQILYNKCVDLMTSQQKQIQLSKKLAVENNNVDRHDESVGDATKLDIAALNVEARQLLYLHYFESFTLMDISEITNTPVGTLKSRLHHIRQQLKATL